MDVSQDLVDQILEDQTNDIMAAVATERDPTPSELEAFDKGIEADLASEDIDLSYVLKCLATELKDEPDIGMLLGYGAQKSQFWTANGNESVVSQYHSYLMGLPHRELTPIETKWIQDMVQFRDMFDALETDSRYMVFAQLSAAEAEMISVVCLAKLSIPLILSKVNENSSAMAE
jgi:hypothetical protein